MSRIYEKLKCGCMVSLDGGGGLMPCDPDGENPNCQWDAWSRGVAMGKDFTWQEFMEILDLPNVVHVDDVHREMLKLNKDLAGGE